MAYLRRWHSYDRGHLLFSFFSQRDGQSRGASLISRWNGIAWPASRPSPGIRARCFPAMRVPGNLGSPAAERPGSGVVILSIPRHYVHNYRNGNRYQRRAWNVGYRPNPVKRATYRERARQRRTARETQWTRVFLHRTKWRGC